MRIVALGELTETVGTWNPTRSPEDEFEYIDLSAVDNDSKMIRATTSVTGAEAPSRARQLVSAGDVLVSTVRPNLNAVAMVPVSLDGATASTGFTVLRPTRVLDGRYLFHWVRSKGFIGEMVRKATGASYPAVSDRILKASMMPVPEVEEQRRIAAILDQADALRAKRRQILAHLDTLTQSIFHDMFGDLPASSTVEDLVRPGTGNIRTGPFGSQLLHSEFVDEGIAVLGLDNVVGNEFRWAERRFITPEKYQKLSRYTVKPGDVLISIMGTTGRCVVVPEDIPVAINTKHICAMTFDQTLVLPQFVRAAFLWHPGSLGYLRRQTKGSIMDGLNITIIKSMPLPVPRLDLQREFVRRVGAVHVARERAEAGALDELFASLQSRAFRGEL